MSPRLVAVIQATAVIAAGCCAGVLAKLTLREVPPFTFVWLQIAIGGSLLSLYTFGWCRRRIPRGLGLEVWSYIVWIGIANFTVVRVLFVTSLERLPATTHIYLVNFVGIVTMLMSVAILRERPALVQVAGAVVAILGLRLFFPSIPPPDELTGVIQLAIAVCALASTNNLARKLAIVAGDRVSNLVVSTLACWIGGVPVVLAGLATDWPPPVPDAASFGIIALNGVVAITIGLTVWNHILRTLRSYEAAILAGSSVIFVALLAWPILGERLAPHQLGGIALMLAGMVMAQLRRSPRPERADQ